MSFSPANTGSRGVIGAGQVHNILEQHIESGWGYQQNALSPVVSTSQQSELALIYRALLELRAEINELKERMSTSAPNYPLALPASGVMATNGLADAMNLERQEKNLIHKALQRFEGDRKLAANALGISERTLYRKLKEFSEEKV